MHNGTEKYHSSIAIIGGGYAGLTLANYMQTMNRIQCYVLEAKEEAIPIVGTIRLPHARPILQELGLLEDNESSIFQGVDLVDRQRFQGLLRSNITIEHSCRIVRMEEEKVRGGTCLWDTQGRKHGPFDWIILATGIWVSNDSSVLVTSEKTPSFQQGAPVTAVLGDARWQYDTWFWDFGRQRIQKGGDIALYDAQELAHCIMQSIGKGDDFRPEHLTVPSKFRLKTMASLWHYQWHASRIVFFSVLVSIFVRLLLALEKI